MSTPHNTGRYAKHRRLTNQTPTHNDDGGGTDGRDHEQAIPEKQIHRWIDDGGAGPPARPEIRTVPCVWTPTTLKARLEAQLALDALPRHPWGNSAAARSTLARIVAQVEQRILAQEAAAEQLRELTISLARQRRSDERMPRTRSRRP